MQKLFIFIFFCIFIFDEETIKNAYLKALNILPKDKEHLISNLLLAKEKLLDVNLS